MIVVDASAMVEALIGGNPDPVLLDALTGDVHAPHLLDVEVMAALRGLELGGKVDPGAAENARQDFLAMTIIRHELSPLADRVWVLRHQFTSYDACYVTLAEALEAPLYTCDATLAGGGHRAEVRVLPLSRGQ